MFEPIKITAKSKSEFYDQLGRQLSDLLESERDLIANAANTASLLFHAMPDVNWAGFYIFMGGQLVLGPFQGKPACTRIALGAGVCGAAAQSGETIVVPDVAAFPGHIACDRASQSEIAAPLISDGRLVGVMDIDSPRKARFNDEDRKGCEALAEIFLQRTDV
jgi:L-methionine (R)-S-oxide reductase